MAVLCAVWEWLDEHGLWHPYAGSVQQLLQQAEASAKNSVSITAAGRQYTVSLKNLTQVNDDTGVSRAVRCSSSGTPAAAPSKSASSSQVKQESATASKSSSKSSGASSGIACCLSLLVHVSFVSVCNGVFFSAVALQACMLHFVAAESQEVLAGWIAFSDSCYSLFLSASLACQTFFAPCSLPLFLPNRSSSFVSASTGL